MPARTKEGGGRARGSFPWFVLLALVGSAYLFWILPMQLGPAPVEVEFSKELPVKP